MVKFKSIRKVLFFFLFITGSVANAFSQIWKQEPLHRLTLQEYEMTLDFWTKKYPDRLTVERIDTTAEGAGLYLLKITDKKIADTDKQVALISALHGGPERSGSSGAFAVIDWLLSDDKEAIETRRKQLVLVMPVNNPYSFFVSDKFGNSKKLDPYTGGGLANWDVEKLQYKKAADAPELMAFLKVVDQYKPDISLDLHGTGFQEYNAGQKAERDYRSYRGQIMFEVTGMAYSNSILRPWDWRITEKMVKAGIEAGFPTDRGEADAQQSEWLAGMPKMDGQYWRGRPQFYTAQYSYLKYHTLLSCLEIAWEASGVARSMAMLRIGNTVWEGEKRSGYPVNKLHAFVGRYVTAWGKTASELRESRVELWQKQAAFNHGVIYPETEGRESFVVGLTEKGKSMMDEDFHKFVTNIQQDESINAKEIESYIKKGPEIKLAFEKSGRKGLQEGFIQKGLGLRLRIPFATAFIKNIRLNGHLLKPGIYDGYETWIGDGYLQVQINIPPAKAALMDIAIITCEYDSKQKRSYGWAPPREVLKALGK